MGIEVKSRRYDGCMVRWVGYSCILSLLLAYSYGFFIDCGNLNWGCGRWKVEVHGRKLKYEDKRVAMILKVEVD